MRINPIFLILLLLPFYAHSAPREIILLRHADKLVQTDPGPTLSPKGYIRSLKFSEYILSHFGEPDFIIAGKPKGKNASIRELQTVAPLVNVLSARHPETGFNILHPYEHDEHQKLANYLLKDEKFNDKLVLICWRHTKIVELAKSLGVMDNLEAWPDLDYDSVYIIKYDPSGNVISFSHLKDQYPVKTDVSWDDLYALF